MRLLCSKQLLGAALGMSLLGTLLAAPQRTLDRLHLGESLMRPIAGDTVDRLVVSLTEGQFAKVLVMQSGSDVVATLRDPAQRVLMESDLPNAAFGAEIVATIAESAGDYVVEVKLGNPQAPPGAYQVTVEAARPANPADRNLVSAYQTFLEANAVRKQRTPEARRRATEMFNLARPMFAASGDRYPEALGVFLVGSMLADSGEIAAALRYAEEAAGLFHEQGDLIGEAGGRNNMGGMLDILGEPRKALDAYREALRLQRAGGNRPQEANVLNNIGKIESDLGNWQNALDDYKDALSLVRQMGNTRLEALFSRNIGDAYIALGDFEAALSTLEQALALNRSARNKSGEGDALQGIASAYALSKQHQRTLEYLQQALEIETSLGDRRQEGRIKRNIGRTYRQLGRLSEAEKPIREAVELSRTSGDRRDAALALLDLSRVFLLQNRLADSLQRAEEALTDFRAIGDRNSEAGALETISRVESAGASGRMDVLRTARDHMEQALRLIEESRTRTDSEQFRASFFATQQDSHAYYIDLLMSLGEPNAALEVNERARARSMLDLLAEAGTDIREGVDAKLLAREREITDLLNAKGARMLSSPQPTLPQEIRELETEFQDVQAAIRKNSPRYAALAQPQPLTVAEIQRELLDADSLLLEYSLGEPRSYLWAVGKTDIYFWELPARARIEEQVERVSELVAARSAVKRLETPAEKQKRIAAADAELPAATRDLSAMILAPASSVLGNRSLLVVPDGALQRLPFAMLPLGSGRNPEPLIVSHEVVMLPSASALAALRGQTSGRKPAPKMVAVFADPVFDATDPRFGPVTAAAPAPSLEASRILEHLTEPGDAASVGLKIPRLPYTAQEADQILSAARGGANLKAIGLDASRAAATSGQLSEYRYIHFATHGYLDTERPSLSALVLSQVDASHQRQDGFLRVNDIYNARLNADLVVLSACQTGLGKEVRGEGLMGLTRAFLYAGAPRVIVSLWNVNDRATADLMSSLYRRMLREGKRPSAALREAQMEMRRQKQWESPYYWAAFVQHGEWR